MRPLDAVKRWLGHLASSGEGDPPYRPVRAELAWLAGVVALAVALRFLGLRLGLPYHHHWDEVLVTSSARGMIERGDDVPSNFFYGAPLMRLTALGYAAAKALGLPGVREAVLRDEVILRWVGRVVAATIASSGTIAVYVAARSLFARGAEALLSAFVYAVAAELVWHGRYAVTDASVTALTAWTLAFTAAYARKRTLLLGALAVAASGLTFAFKLTGLATVLLPVGALALLPARGVVRANDSPPPRWLATAERALLAAAVPLVVLTFLWLNPHVRDQWQRAFRDFEGIAKHYREGHVKPFCEREPGLEHLGSALYFTLFQGFHTNAAASLAMSAPGVLGVALALRRARLPVVLGVVHALGVVVAMAWPNRAYLTRMYLPALPILCVGFGHGLGWLFDRLPERLRHARAAAWGSAAVVVLASATTVLEALETQRLATDPRMRAMDYVAERAKREGREVTVALTPAVAGNLALGGHAGIRRYLAREGVRLVADVGDRPAAEASGADFVVLASHRNIAKIWPYEEQWVFTEASGYARAATFPFGPYEHRLDLQPTWDGHVTAVVLEKQR